MREPDSGNFQLALFIGALLFIAFIVGALLTVAKVFPYSYVKDAYRAGTALYEKLTGYTDPLTTDLWAKAKTPAKGVTIHDPTRAMDGYTLYTSGDAPKATLISMDGQVVYTWERPYSSIWDETAAARDPVPDSQTYFRRAELMPNGDLLAIYIGVGDSPYGYGMVKLDKKSKPIWKNLDHFHHDFDVGDDGHIYGLTHAYRTAPIAGADQFEPPFLDDYLTVVDADDGRTLKKISILDAIARSPYRRLLWRVHYYSLEDPLHTNAVDFLDAGRARALARKLPQAARGQVLLSFRELAGGSVALLDVDKEEIVWVSRGPWIAQHDPDILPDGDLLVFDNLGHFGPGGTSRVIEVDPATGGITWSYTGTGQQPLESSIRSAQQRLANGNTLITESNGGRLLEVTGQGDIVWEYINPVRAGKDKKKIPIVSWAQRIDPANIHGLPLADSAPPTSETKPERSQQ